LQALLTPRLTKYIPWVPTETQTAFLLCDAHEALYGGAAGGGKSVALLMAALQYVDVPGYHALILRRTFAALSKPGALIDLAHDWLHGTDAVWNESRKQWTFPSGATLSFGYLDTENDKYQYQGAAFHFIGFDELTQFTASQYRYLFSRRRRPKDLGNVPLRTRAASNPGGEGHEWVYQRFFVEGKKAKRVFIPAKLDDNPYLDAAEYRQSLAELDPIERAQLEHGDWRVKKQGDWFHADWFEVVEPDEVPIAGVRWARHWDLASTKPSERNKEPDYTVGLKMGERDGTYYIGHVERFREGPTEGEARMGGIAKRDGTDVEITTELEPGSNSRYAANAWARGIFKGYAYEAVPATGDKKQRAKPLATAARQGRVKLVRGPWIQAFLDELTAFPDGPNDDQVDAASGVFARLHVGGGGDEIRTKPLKPKLRGLAAMSL
jgi:predicted phage terminase large subunit-like protein